MPPAASANASLVQFERDRLLAAIPLGTQRILIQTLGQERPEVAVQALADRPQLYEALGQYDLVEEYNGRRSLGRGLMIGGGVGMAMGLALAPMALIASAVSENDEGGAIVTVFFVGGAAALLTGIVLPYHPTSAAERAAMIAKHNASMRGSRAASLPRIMPSVGKQAAGVALSASF